MTEQYFSAESEALQLKRVLRNMLAGLLGSRYIAYRLVVKDVKAGYAKSALGMMWDLVDPLIVGLIFWTLMRYRVLTPGKLEMPYAIFVIYGLLLYTTFCEAVIMSVDVLGRSRGLLSHLKLPPEALILSVFFRVMFNSLFRIVVMLLFSLVLHRAAVADGLSAFSPVGFLKFLGLFTSIVLAGMAIGLLVAPFNAIYGDVGRATRIVLLPLRYLTPVLWPIPDTGAFVWINRLNPVGPILHDLRLLATADQMAHAQGFAVRCGIYLIMLFVGWFVFHLSIRVLAARA